MCVQICSQNMISKIDDSNIDENHLMPFKYLNTKQYKSHLAIRNMT